ncbi:MAG: hypothetical protein CSA21_03890 [Deltaproteobacteria bacterium]|nr:MAG: hypothetical protein CSA21_03890 [Deltaproteobacteria bacterium]
MRTSHTTILLIIGGILIQMLLIRILLQSSVQSGILRVAFVPGETIMAHLSPYGPGFQRELVEHFCRDHQLSPSWVEVASPSSGLNALQRHKVDLLLYTGDPSFTRVPKGLVAGPVYQTDHPVILQNTWKQGLLHPQEICDYSLPISRSPAIVSALDDLTQVLHCPDVDLASSASSLHTLLTDMTSRKIRFAVVGAGAFQLWQPFFPDIRPALALHHHVVTRWIWNTRSHDLARDMTTFWQDLLTSPVFNNLQARYYGFFPQHTDFYELSHLNTTLASKLPPYTAAIAHGAKTNGLDPLLVAAMIYQESHFNAKATSKTGVRGLLQISQTTARELGISNRLDPRQSIQGGVTYLRSLIDRLQPLDMDVWNTLFFALAAYNQGMGHLRDAMTLAQRLGKDAHSWQVLKEVFPLLSQKQYYQQAAHGYCRGIETVDYVDSIRYYYYYLTGLARLARPQDKAVNLLAARNTVQEGPFAP